MKKIVFTLLLVILLTSCNSLSESYDNVVTTNNNIQNMGFICKKNKLMYFTNYFPDKNVGIFKKSENGKETNIDERNFCKLNTIGKYIIGICYYTNDGDLELQSYNTDNGEFKTINESTVFVQYHKDLIYVDDKEGILVIDTNGNIIKKIKLNLKLIDFNFFVTSNCIYFINFNSSMNNYGLYKCDLDGVAIEHILDFNPDYTKLIFNNNNIFYSNTSDSYKIYKVDLCEKKIVKVTDCPSNSYNVYGNILYYSDDNENNINSLDLETNKVSRISNEGGYNFCIIDKILYYKINKDDKVITKQYNIN